MSVPSVDLAHEPELRLGPLTVRPGLRQLVAADGAVEFLEPRVMQVLVALARADGAVLTRDELTAQCWEGRIVGEDAINRVISRLRRLNDGFAAGVFRIETITKVGYRLVRLDRPEQAAEPAMTPAGLAPLSPPPLVDADQALPRAENLATGAPARAPVTSRRGVLVTGGALLAAAVGGVIWDRRRARAPALDPAASLLIEEGRDALRQVESGSTAQAVGLLRRAVELAPGSADAWGLLATAYVSQLQARPTDGVDELRLRAEAALARARALDPANPHVANAEGLLLPKTGRWRDVDRVYRNALARHPNSGDLLFAWGIRQSMVGRLRDSATSFERAAAVLAKPAPGSAFFLAQSLWGAGRLEEADRAIDQAMALFPLHFAVWFTRYFLYLYTGRAERALAMGADSENRPRGIPVHNFDLIQLVARAMISRAPADIDVAVARNLEAAREGAGFAENTMQFAAALGRLDDAFAVADAYFFSRGFAVAERRFSEMQGIYTRVSDRRTTYLFTPSTAAMRRDPRFEKLVEEIGLARYWRDAGVTPDYRARG